MGKNTISTSGTPDAAKKIGPKNKMLLRFVVNEEKRTVVAILTNVHAAVLMKTHAWGDIFYWPRHYKSLDKLVAVAKCDPNDTWDVELGKRLAYARVEAAFNKEILRAADHYLNLMLKLQNQVANTYSKHAIIGEIQREKIDAIIEQTKH